MAEEKKEKLQQLETKTENNKLINQKSSSKIQQNTEMNNQTNNEVTEELTAKEYNQPKLKTADGREIFTIVIKSDLRGSIDALKTEINKIKAEEIDIQIIDAGTGALALRDITIASMSRAVIIAFNIPISSIFRIIIILNRYNETSC